MKNREIIVLQGPPACGKSTYAKKLHKENQNYVIVSRDNIRESRGEYWIPSQEDYISSIEEFQIRTAVEMGLTPVIDATNLNKKTLDKWNSLAKELNATLTIHELEVPSFKEALKRDNNRKRPVGEKVLRRFYLDYYPHLMEEYRYMKEFTGKPQTIIVDLDGTLSIMGPRSPYDYDKVYMDKIDFRLSELLKEILNETKFDIIFLTDRDAICREQTVDWLEKNFKEQFWSNRGVPQYNWKLYMRNEGDRRPDFEVKRAIYKERIEPWRDVVAVFEDRDQCVDMWREEGLLCLQPSRGNF